MSVNLTACFQDRLGYHITLITSGPDDCHLLQRFLMTSGISGISFTVLVPLTFHIYSFILKSRRRVKCQMSLFKSHPKSKKSYPNTPKSNGIKSSQIPYGIMLRGSACWTRSLQKVNLLPKMSINWIKPSNPVC